MRDQIVLGGKVSVKAAVRQLRSLHDVGDADAVKPPLAKQRACRIDDAFTMLSGLLPAYSQGAPQLCGRRAMLDSLYDGRHRYVSNYDDRHITDEGTALDVMTPSTALAATLARRNVH